jgi:ABC-type transport system involved in multi-copper enzyme maturation permease subunit
MTAIPGFFLSSYFLMLLWGVISPEFGIATISYVKAMLVTITIWLVVAPVFAVARSKYHFHYKA